MTFTITLPPEAEAKLRECADRAGQSIEDFVGHLIVREVLGVNGRRTLQPDEANAKPSFDEIFAPLRREVENSGISDQEQDRLLKQARDEVWQERKAMQGKDA